MKIKQLKTKEIGYPVTPSKWTGTPEYKKISKVTYESGRTIRTVYVHRIFDDELKTNEIITFYRVDGKAIKLNTRYIIEIEDFTLVTIEYVTLNPVYEVVREDYQNNPEDTYKRHGKKEKVSYLIEDGETVELIDKFMWVE